MTRTIPVVVLLALLVAGAPYAAAQSTPTVRKVATIPEDLWLGNLMTSEHRTVGAVGFGTDLAIYNVETLAREVELMKKSADASLTTTGNAAISPDGRRVLFGWAPEKGAAEMRVTDVKGGNMRTVKTFTAGHYPSVAGWLPDNDRAVLVDWNPSNMSGELLLFSIARGDSQTLKTFAKQAPTDGAVSPDGRYLLYAWETDTKPPKFHLWMLDLQSRTERALTTGEGNDSRAIWAPNGSTVYFASDRSGVTSLWAQDVSNGTPAGPPREVQHAMGDFSPLGFDSAGRLFYTLFVRKRESFAVRLDATGRMQGTSEKLAFTRPSSFYNFSWSREGKQLLYTEYAQDNLGATTPRVVFRDVATGTERTLQPQLASFWNSDLSFDGKQLVGSGIDEQQNRGVFVVDAATGAARLLMPEPPITDLASNFTDNIGAPRFSRDGKAVFYTRGGKGVFKRDLATGMDSQVVQINEPYALAGAVLLSPDGTSVAFGLSFLKDPKRQTEIRVASLADGHWSTTYFGPPNDIFSSSSAGVGPVAWTPDGKSLFVAGKTNAAEKVSQLWVMPASGGALVPTGLSGEQLGVAVHPDGRQVLFSVGKSSQEVWVAEGLDRARSKPVPARR